MIESPVYISGHYRSGTTLLANILDKSPELSITYGTIHYMRSYGRYNPIESRYAELIKDTCERIQKKWDIESKEQDMLDLVASTPKVTEAVVYDAMMRVFLDLKDSSRWGEKTNVNWEGILPFLDMFPQGKVVHIIRDPRAVLASFKFFTFQPEPGYLDSIFANLAMFDFIERNGLRSREGVYLIRYEDLVTNPQDEVTKLCRFLNIDFQESMMEINNADAKKTYNANSTFFESKNAIDESSKNLWETKLTSVDIHFCQEMLSEGMHNWGYEPVEVNLSSTDSQELATLKNHPYISKRLRYVEQHGTGIQAFPDTDGAYE